jgi:hypothetical protein
VDISDPLCLSDVKVADEPTLSLIDGQPEEKPSLISVNTYSTATNIYPLRDNHNVLPRARNRRNS